MFSEFVQILKRAFNLTQCGPHVRAVGHSSTVHAINLSVIRIRYSNHICTRLWRLRQKPPRVYHYDRVVAQLNSTKKRRGNDDDGSDRQTIDRVTMAGHEEEDYMRDVDTHDTEVRISRLRVFFRGWTRLIETRSSSSIAPLFKRAAAKRIDRGGSGRNALRLSMCLLSLGLCRWRAGP